MPDEQQIKTVDEKGKAPKNRISSPQAAWKAYQDSVHESSKNDARFSSIRGIFDGFPPEDPVILEAEGLVNAPNFNTRQFQAKVDAYVSTWVEINSGGDKWYEIKAKSKHANSAEDQQRYSDDLTTFFNDAIKEWDGEGMKNGAEFVFESCVKDTQMGLFGIGVAYFQDPIDWRWGVVPTRKIHVPQGTKITLSNCPAMFIERPYTVTQLYGYVEDEDTAQKTGWNRKAVLQLLYLKTSQQPDTELTRFSDWENHIRNNASELQQNFAPVELVDVYVQEFTAYREKDKISHYIIARQSNNHEFLYKKDREYGSWREIIVAFADNCGPEGDWHGVKGFGDLIYDNCHFNNQMFNAIALGAIMSTLPMFQAGSEADRQKLSQIVLSRMAILFPEVPVAQIKLNTDLSGSLAVFAESNRMLNSNTRIFPQNDQTRAGQVKTATQETFDRQDQAQFTGLQIKFYRLTGADRLGWEMYRRISKPSSEYPETWPGGKVAKAFRDRCKEAGISEECMRDVEYVRAARGGGSGNVGLDSLKADQAIAVSTPGKGQLNARKEKIKALYGTDMVPAFIQEEQPSPGFENWCVMMENTTLQNGQMIPALPYQPPEIHLGIGVDGQINEMGHLAVLSATQQAATQIQESEGGVESMLQDAIKLNKVLEAVIDHVATHVEFMRQVPAIYEDQVKELDKLINDSRQFNENLATDIGNAMQKAQQQQPQVDPETQAMMAKTQAEIQAQMMKAEADIEISGMKAAAKEQNMAQVSESRQRIKEQEALVKMGLDTEQALIDQQRQKAEIEAKTRAQKNVESVKK